MSLEDFAKSKNAITKVHEKKIMLTYCKKSRTEQQKNPFSWDNGLFRIRIIIDSAHHSLVIFFPSRIFLHSSHFAIGIVNMDSDLVV